MGTARKNIPQKSLFASKSDFDNFFKENYHAACLVALRYIPDINQSEDLIQEVFISFWEKRQELHVQSNLKNYFLTTIKNIALKTVQRRRDKTVPLSSLAIDFPDIQDTEKFDQEELAANIFKAVEELPPSCRTIFKLAYKQQYTYQQIAEHLNISKNTVKTQMGIAYKQLRNKLTAFLYSLFSIFFKKTF